MIVKTTRTIATSPGPVSDNLTILLKLPNLQTLFFSEVLEARERMEEEERSPSDREAVTDGASGGVSPPHAGLGASRPS